MKPPPPPNPRQILKSAKLSAKKSWGQNFVRDQNILQIIARATGVGPSQPVLELGAGLGALTYHLLLAGGTVYAIERDRELVPLLQEALAWADNLKIIEDDVAKFDYAKFGQSLNQPLIITGNLPYQISSRILVTLANAFPHVNLAVVMVQKEVAQRLVAKAGNRDYGMLTVLVGRVFTVELLKVVPPTVFYPQPKVDSAIIVLKAHGKTFEPKIDDLLVRAAKAAFSHRRKTLKNSISTALGKKGLEVAKALEKANINQGLRAEALSIEQFANLGIALFG